MRTEAWLMMLTSCLLVTGFTVYFFYKVFTAKKDKTDS